MSDGIFRLFGSENDMQSGFFPSAGLILFISQIIEGNEI